MEDTLFSRFATDNLAKADDKLSEDVISTKFFTRLLNNTQKKVESLNYDTRKNLIDYDHVLSNQRELIYKQRDKILISLDNKDILYRMLDSVIDYLIYQSHNKPNEDIIDIKKLIDLATQNIFYDNYLNQDEYYGLKFEQIKTKLKKDCINFFEQKEQLMTPTIFNQILSEIMISNIDEEWTKHLDITSKIREGVNLRAYEQKAPLNIYVEDSDKLFEKLKHNVAWKTVCSIGKINYVHQDYSDLNSEFIVNDNEINENNNSIDFENFNESIPTDQTIQESFDGNQLDNEDDKNNN